ncbi:MAG: magnesium/cobalt transporter CorA [Thermoanaerobaculia bacterium]|nr:magnesium/cobalt transporter CorA [Thermoanaerobaculia bacterium]
MRGRIIRTVTPGTAPGALEPPRQRVESVEIQVVCFDADSYQEMKVDRIDEALGAIEDARVTWINVIGLHDVELLATLGRRFGIHPLALEDVVNIGQRPKHEHTRDHIFVIMRLLHLLEAGERGRPRRPGPGAGRGGRLEVEQVSLFFGRGYVLTLQEIPDDDPFEPLREQIRSGSGQVRERGPDYLAYRMIDILVDSLYPVLERYGERIERIEDELLDRPTPELLSEIQDLKRELLWIRRTAWPHRDLVTGLQRLEHDLISAETRLYLADSYDHCVQLIDVTNTFRELATGLTDLYLTTTSNRMNEIMKVLTIMASIFIPLTFIAGIYGMNFDPESSSLNMPELHWAYGYPTALALMAMIAVGMVLYFKLKRWL